MQRFRASDDAREHLVSEVLAKYRSLSEEHFILKNDYASERDIRRNYQNTVEEKQSLVREYERQLESSSFVLALIDGDGAIFQDALLQAAVGDGGSEAASRLHHAIRNHLATIYSNSDNWSIMVQIYLSLDKLAMKLAQVGLLRSPQELRAFAQRFSVNQPLFSIIDVGQGKERADHKIKEMLRTFSDNPTCRHIVFGGCHDAGYLLNLEHFKHVSSKAARITLLETTPAYRGFSELSNFLRARFDNVFRTEPLPEYAPPLPPTATPNFVQPLTQVPVQPSSRPKAVRNNSSPTGTPKPSVTSPSPSTTSLSTAATESNSDSSWATIGKSGAPANGSISIAPSNTKTNSKKKYAYYNKAEQRLDEALPPKDPAAAFALETRMKKADTDKHIIFRLSAGGHFKVEMFATEDDDCPIPDSWDYIPTLRRTSPQTNSGEALVKMKSWVAQCIVNHSDSLCDSPENPTLPTRVVDVGLRDGRVKLLEANGAKAKYICLSHCWGLEQIIMTTRMTLEDHKRGIAWDELSKTFQDAITLTRTLGFEYIWIDSLCIIQDDSRDWEIESAKMAAVYTNGSSTIAATRSANGHGGLFCRTEDFKVSGETPEGEDYCLYFRERIHHQIDASFETEDSFSSEKYYPLLSRAWVYQERMLSTRVLHFGRYELFFECKSSAQCECGSIRYHGAGFETPVALIKLEYANALSNFDVGYEGQALANIQYQCARLWRTMVCCYTALFLTKSKDRLPAIGGLARHMATKRESKYRAGLWQDSLQEDILWMVYTTPKLKKPRPYPLNAPTWSWASVETFVDYWNVIVVTDVDGPITEERPPYQHFVTIEKCDVEESAIDEFGSIAHGSLTLSGLIAEGTLERETQLHNGEVLLEHYVSFTDTSRLALDSDYLLENEGPGHTAPGTPILYLRMSLYQEGQKEYLLSLALRESMIPGCFERIGTSRIIGSIGSLNPEGGVFRMAKSRTVVVI
ncbi:Nn.00g077900.m01.CDS01 [Neocucurbitaria sp. VM-36]